MIEIEWSSGHGVVVHRRTNVCRLSDSTIDVYSRLVTFEGAEHNSLLGTIRVSVAPLFLKHTLFAGVATQSSSSSCAMDSLGATPETSVTAVGGFSVCLPVSSNGHVG